MSGNPNLSASQKSNGSIPAFAAGHRPRAINIQLSDFDKRLNGLPRDREIIAYCRGAYCVLSFEAVARLRNKGIKARRLVEGFPEWKAVGPRVDSTAAEKDEPPR